MKDVYLRVKEFDRKYSSSIAWRLKAHSKIIAKHLNPDEYVSFAFACQRNDNVFDIINTCVVSITNKRILIGQKRLLFGYRLISITPDLYNDLTIKAGLIWGKIYIDTVKEVVKLSNISIDALPEIETNITEFMMKEKKKYRKESD